jgi:hypothetical protein
MGVLQKFITLLQFKPDETSVKGAEQVIEGLKGKLTAFAAVAAPAALGAAIWSRINEVSQLADAQIKAARAAGVASEAYQELTHAAGMSGVSQGALDTTLRSLNRQVHAAARGNKGLAESYRRVGLSAREMAKLSPEDQLDRVADVLAGVSDEGERARIAQELLGKQGPQLVSMLAGGSQGLREMRQEAQDLGIVMSKEAGESAEAFNDSLARLGKAARAAKDQFLIGLLPAITPIIQELTDWRKGESKRQISSYQAIGKSIAAFLKRVLEALKELRAFIDTLGGTSQALKILGVIIASFLAARWLLNLSKGVSMLTVANLRWAASTAAAVAPYLILAAVIAGIILLVQDFYGFLTGEESLLEEFVGPATPELIADIQRGLLVVLGILGVIAVVIGSIPIAILAVIGLVALLILYWDEVKQTMSEFFTTLYELADDARRAIYKSLVQAFESAIARVREMWSSLIDGLVERLQPLINAVGRVAGIAGSVATGARDVRDGALARVGGLANDITGRASALIAGRPQQNNAISVEVDARGMNATQAAAAVEMGVSDGMLRAAQRQFAGRASGT